MRRDVAVIILYNAKKKILLQHRTENAKRLPDYWGFFGGKIEEEENPEEAVKREVIEELNYKVEQPKLVMTQSFKHKRERGIKYVFIEEYNSKQELILKEGQGMAWYSPDEVSKLKIIDHDREVIKYIQNRY